MHILALALALAAADGAPSAIPAAAPVPVVTAPVRATPPPAPPALVSADPAPARPAAPVASPPAVSASEPATPPFTTPPGAIGPAAPAPAAGPPAPPPPAMTPTTATPPASTPPPAAYAPPPPLPQAAVEKLGLGDRAFLERDYRSALFAYQDAVYLAPRNPRARVKLGRAYLALRYPVQAIAQAEQALAADPANLEARRLLEEARSPPARPAPSAISAVEPPARTSPPPDTAAPGPRVFRFEPEPEDAHAARAAAHAPSSVPPAGAGEGAPPTGDRPLLDRGGTRTVSAVKAEAVAAAPVVAAVPAPSAAQRYREALALLGDRNYEGAAAALTEAIDLDPRLAVAHAARGSARVGLGRHRDAADDYRAALALDPGLSTPLYGLAECYRVLGDADAAAGMYQRYAQSRAPDVREDLRAIAAKRAQELRP